MTQQQYSELAANINQALNTAGVTTLVFTAKSNETINAVVYVNILDFSGYFLQSASINVQNIINKEMTKYGAFSIIKSPSRVVTPPANPVNDHYQVSFGYFLNNSDLSADAADESKLNSGIEGIAQNNITAIKNAVRPLKYSVTASNSTYTISASDISGNRTITINTTATINKPV